MQAQSQGGVVAPTHWQTRRYMAIVGRHQAQAVVYPMKELVLL